MTDSNQPVGQHDLHAYVDGALAPVRRDEVAACLAQNPALAGRVSAYRRINDALHTAYDPALGDPIPVALVRILAAGKRPVWRGIAVIGASLITGLLLGWGIADGPSRGDDARPLPRQAAFAHAVYLPEVLHPVEVEASKRAHLNTWLSKRLQHPVSAPDVRDAGYQLVGGRLLPDAGRPAAQFMYEDTNGDRLTLYVRTLPEPYATKPMRFVQDAEFGIVDWADGPLAFALTGSADEPGLMRIARRMHAQLIP